jgi:hypothetical protein
MTEQADIDSLMIADSDVSEVYEIPMSPNYTVRSKMFQTEHVVKAYTKDMTIDPGGWIRFEIQWRRGNSRTVSRPFHFIKNGILYAMKRNKHQMSDAFALNHELFAIEWDSCVILHQYGDRVFVFITSREEWEHNAFPGHQNQELQVFMEVPDYRRLPCGVMPDGSTEWFKACLSAGFE